MMPGTFAVGDIHGSSDLLNQLLTRLEEEAGPEDRFIFLGDYVDRGPDSRGVLDQLIHFAARHPGQALFLLGNHEQVLLKTRSDPTQTTWPFFMEGLPTVRSYSPAAAEELTRTLGERGYQIFTDEVRQPLPYESFWAAVPDQHLLFLMSLRRYHLDSEDYLFVHAGIDPSIDSLEDQPEDALLWQDTSRLWRSWRGPPTLVVGHVSTDRVDPAAHGRPLLGEHMLMLDTGCPESGVLSAVRLPDRAVFQARR